jgi:Ser/Thr protein kinase RdoA (MazF antagonist)
MTGPPARVLGLLGLRPASVVALKDVPMENASWLAETSHGHRLVLRRYHDGAMQPDLAYEHAVLRHLARSGWVVPEPLGELVREAGQFYCLTRYVPGQPVARESAAQRRRRGRDLARLHLALRGLGDRLAQRQGWRALHMGVTVKTDIDWDACMDGLMDANPRLGSWLQRAAAQTRLGLDAAGAAELSVTVVHGDFAEWNVHYDRGRLAGVIDFGLTHLDSRPYELAMARTYRSPEVAIAYRAELARHGWPLSELEEALYEPVYRAFRVDMAAWQANHGLRAGRYDLGIIERQLERSGVGPG